MSENGYGFTFTIHKDKDNKSICERTMSMLTVLVLLTTITLILMMMLFFKAVWQHFVKYGHEYIHTSRFFFFLFFIVITKYTLYEHGIIRTADCQCVRFHVNCWNINITNQTVRVPLLLVQLIVKFCFFQLDFNDLQTIREETGVNENRWVVRL